MESCCRTCSRSDIQGISVDAISENTGEPVYLMLIYCTQLQFSNRDNFPQQICYDCMTRLDAAYSFWKQSRQADATLQQQLLLSSNSERVASTTAIEAAAAATIANDALCSPSYPALPPDGQTQIEPDHQEQHQDPLPLQSSSQQDDEANFQAEEVKVNAQTQVIAIDEEVESEPETVEAAAVEEPPAPPPLVSIPAGEDSLMEEALRHQQYIIDSEAESDVIEDDDLEPELQRIEERALSKPTFKIKMNHNRKSNFMVVGKLKCNICKATFHTSHHLNRHLQMHQIACKDCGKFFASLRSCQRHQKKNCPVLKNVTYKAYCEHCNRGFTKQSTIKRHQEQVCPVLHPEGSTYINSAQCKYCKKGFSSIQNAERHQRENCPVLKRPNQSHLHLKKQCAYCRKRFNTSKEIKRHVRHCLRRRPATPAPPPPDDIDSPAYEVHPSDLLDCVMKQEALDEELIGN